MERPDTTGPVRNGGSSGASVVSAVSAADPAALIRAALPPGALDSPPAMLAEDDLDEDPTGDLDGLVSGVDVGDGVDASLGGAMDGPEAEVEGEGAGGPPPGASALPPRALSVREIDNIHKLAANFRSLGLDPESLAHAPYRRVLLSGESALPPTGEAAAAAAMLRAAISLREKWLYRREVEEWDTPARPAPPRPSPYTTFVPPPYDPFDEPLPAASAAVCHWEEGVLVVYASPAALMRRTPIYPHRRWREFADDLRSLMSVVVAPAARSFCHLRLKLLAERFAMHATLNERQERLEQAAVPHRDFYNVRKVDTHVHHSSSMNQKHLLRFIKSKVRRCGDDKVLIDRSDPSGERVLTLTEVFTSLNLTTHELSVDTLDMHADNTTFHRFDRFNLKYVWAGGWPGGVGTCGLMERPGGGRNNRHGVGCHRGGGWHGVGSAVGRFGVEPPRPCGHSDARVPFAIGYSGVGCGRMTHRTGFAFVGEPLSIPGATPPRVRATALCSLGPAADPVVLCSTCMWKLFPSCELVVCATAAPFPLTVRYSPAGQSRLREVFMKTDNLMGGRYLAEITHELFADLRDTKYQHSEPRLSIYGRAPDEWAKLATWAVDHKIYSDNVRWLIQVPRLYSVYRKLGTVESFQVRGRPVVFFYFDGGLASKVAVVCRLLCRQAVCGLCADGGEPCGHGRWASEGFVHNLVCSTQCIDNHSRYCVRFLRVDWLSHLLSAPPPLSPLLVVFFYTHRRYWTTSSTPSLRRHWTRRRTRTSHTSSSRSLALTRLTTSRCRRRGWTSSVPPPRRRGRRTRTRLLSTRPTTSPPTCRCSTGCASPAA